MILKYTFSTNGLNSYLNLYTVFIEGQLCNKLAYKKSKAYFINAR